MNMFFASNQELWNSRYDDYDNYVRQLLGKLSEDKKLSSFDAFIKRFDISRGVQIEFTDRRTKSLNEVTQDCYRLMLRLSDLWFAFEHLTNTAKDIIRPKSKSKVDLYDDADLEIVGFLTVTNQCNDSLREHVIHDRRWRQELYSSFLPYLQNNTHGATQETIKEIDKLIHAKKPLETRHILALAYGIRNIYAHIGVSAALGGKNYAVKREIYRVIYDALILYSIGLATYYAQQKLERYAIPSG